MSVMFLEVNINRLPRNRCAQCRKRRVLYVIEVKRSLFGAAGSFLSSVARCAKCLGIGK